MRRRPWPILALALLQLLSPLGNVLVSAFLSGVSVSTYLEVQLRSQGTGVFLFENAGLALVAALALYAVKPWSYPVFFLSTCYTSWLSLQSGWKSYQAHAYGLASGLGLGSVILGALLLNLIVGAYLLLPRVRRVFFNKSLRWWESLPRYPLEATEGELFIGQIKDGRPVSITNVSFGGALIESQDSLGIAPGTAVVLRFASQGLRIQADAELLHHREQEGGQRHLYGIRFSHDREGAAALLRNQLHALFHRLEKRGVRSLYERTGILSDLVFWISKLVMRVRGAVGSYALRGALPGDDSDRT